MIFLYVSDRAHNGATKRDINKRDLIEERRGFEPYLGRSANFERRSKSLTEKLLPAVMLHGVPSDLLKDRLRFDSRLCCLPSGCAELGVHGGLSS